MSPVDRGQELPTCTVNSVGRVLLPPSEVPDGLPESLRGQDRWPHRTPPRPRSFCLQDRPGCMASAWPATGTRQLRQESHRPTWSDRICEKLFRRWELKTSLTEGSARRSQQTLTIRLGLPGLSNFLLCQRIQLTTTRW
ncbi:hypothetical protein L3Q82_024338 [Scortum barcoo]|uniref:Uncharacterized protein n=1 Tax=Scortum barcoo TaxID=214431 RepID=A0ACB8WVF7_9TELE|nr:hypothetical protein L3Q82_024338 [Scortum barcoo]